MYSCHACAEISFQSRIFRFMILRLYEITHKLYEYSAQQKIEI